MAVVAGEGEVDLAERHFLYAIITYVDSVDIVTDEIENHCGVSAVLAVIGAGTKRNSKECEDTCESNEFFHDFPLSFSPCRRC